MPATLLKRLFVPRRDPRGDVRPLWHRTVALARSPGWYARLGVADSVAGRFDAIALVLALVLLRLEATPAHAPAAARLTELFVEDMDGQLRESGVGDLAVGKHMGKLMGTLGGRLGALRAALAEPDDTALAAALARNLTLQDGTDPAALAPAARALVATLATLPDAALLAGEIPAPDLIA